MEYKDKFHTQVTANVNFMSCSFVNFFVVYIKLVCGYISYR